MNQSAILYKPQTAYRVRWNMYTDTPFPQEEPAGQNPPDGAIINYYLKENAKEVSLDISDAKGKLIRRYTNKDTLYKIPPNNVPPYWIRPQQILSDETGSHRFTWDKHYEPLNVPVSYPIAAIYKNTAPNETSPFVMPGTYTVKLTVDGKSYSQSFAIKMDPRVKTPIAELQKQHDLSLQCYEGRKKCMETLKDIHAFRAGLQSQLTNAEKSVAEKLGALEKQAAALEGAQGFGFGSGAQQEPTFGRLGGAFSSLFNTLQENDMPPTSQAIAAVADLQTQLRQLMVKWKELKSKTQ